MMVQIGGILFIIATVSMMCMSIMSYDERGYNNAEHLYRRKTPDGRKEDLRRGCLSNSRGFCLDKCMVDTCRIWFRGNSVDDRALE